MISSSQVQTRANLRAKRHVNGARNNINSQNMPSLKPRGASKEQQENQLNVTGKPAEKRGVLGAVNGNAAASRSKKPLTLKDNISNQQGGNKIIKPRKTASKVSKNIVLEDKKFNSVLHETVSEDSVRAHPIKLAKDATASVADNALKGGSRQSKLPPSDSTNGGVCNKAVRYTRSSNNTAKNEVVKSSHTIEDQEDRDELPAAKKSRVSSAAKEVSTFNKVEPPVEWDDLDKEDVNDPLMVSEYVNDIFSYMKVLETETKPNPEYMDQVQKELKWKMRVILVDWLIEVHNKFRLTPETLFLTVNIIDRFLSLRTVSLPKLQLVGITSMFIASKYEEITHPSMSNFNYVADGGYTEEEIMKAERYVLQVLNFSLQYPNPMNFLRRNSKAENYDVQTRTLAKYLMEITLLDNRFLNYVPSEIAAASLYLSRKMLKRGGWTANLLHYSGYSEAHIMPITQIMLECLSKPTKQEALFKKYSTKKFMKASIFVRDWIKEQKHENFGIEKSQKVERRHSQRLEDMRIKKEKEEKEVNANEEQINDNDDEDDVFA